MNQRELIEMHMHLSNRDWEIQAQENDGTWLYIFTKVIDTDFIKIELHKSNIEFSVVTTKNSEERKEVTNKHLQYDQALYFMEEICNTIEKI